MRTELLGKRRSIQKNKKAMGIEKEKWFLKAEFGDVANNVTEIPKNIVGKN